MGDKSGIEWTDATWNPVTGCSHVSDGCRFCYAETLTRRFAGTWGVPDLPWTAGNAQANVIFHPERLDQPTRWRRPRTIFVNSMSDLFHELVPFEYVDRVFEVICANPRHTFQILTKRPERMAEYFGQIEACGPLGDTLPGNVWLGVSIESRRHVDRADILRETPLGEAHRFISAEPLLAPLYRRLESEISRAHDLNLDGIEWLIAGGESGQHFDERPERFLVDAAHRGAPRHWAVGAMRDIRDACEAAGTHFMLKQWGGRTPKSGGRELDGRTYDWTPPRAGATEEAHGG